MGEGEIYETLRRLARRLEEEQLDYALVGGLALVAHGYRRYTEDVDILMRPDTLARFRERLVGRGYRPAFPGATKIFRDTETNVTIDVATTGDFPGDGKPKPVAFPDPAGHQLQRDEFRLITLEKLIELKLASGLSAPHRLRDLSDVQELIVRLELPRDLAASLDPSVRTEYDRLWQAAQSAPRSPGPTG
jgi:hypothetical protein